MRSTRLSLLHCPRPAEQQSAALPSLRKRRSFLGSRSLLARGSSHASEPELFRTSPHRHRGIRKRNAAIRIARPVLIVALISETYTLLV